MHFLSTQDTSINGERLFTHIEKWARAVATLILLFGIFAAIYFSIKGLFQFHECYKHSDSKFYVIPIKSIWSQVLLPQIRVALYYLVVSFFMSEALKALVNISLTQKLKAFAKLDSSVVEPNISLKVEKSVRFLANVIFILCIIVAFFYIVKGIIDYSYYWEDYSLSLLSYSSELSSGNFWDNLAPAILKAVHVLTVAFFAMAILRLLVNISLARKVQALSGNSFKGTLLVDPLKKSSFVKCNECGNPVSKNEEACPNCGNSISNILYYSDEQYEEECKKVKLQEKRFKRRVVMGGIVAFILLIILVYNIGEAVIDHNNDTNQKEYTIQEETTIPEEVKIDDDNKYSIIIYNDNIGEFLNPNGGRICGVILRDQDDNYWSIDLTRNIQIMGKISNTLYISDNRIYADYGELLNGTETSSSPVKILNSNNQNQLSIIFNLAGNQIDDELKEYKPIPLNFDDTKNEYTIVVYKESDHYLRCANGALYDSSGYRICGVSDPSNQYQGNCFFSKTIKLLGDSLSEIYISKGYLYTNHSDYYFGSVCDEEDRHIIKVTETKQDNAIIYKFTNNISRMSHGE